MASLEGHLDQAGHHRAHPQQRLKQEQHGQACHQVLTKGQGEGQQHLGRERSPQAAGPWQWFGDQQGAKHQGQQHQWQLVPQRNHRTGNQRQQPGRGDRQAQAASHEGLGDAPLVHTQSLANHGADGQQQPQQGHRPSQPAQRHQPGQLRWPDQGGHQRANGQRPNGQRANGQGASHHKPRWSRKKASLASST